MGLIKRYYLQRQKVNKTYCNNPNKIFYPFSPIISHPKFYSKINQPFVSQRPVVYSGPLSMYLFQNNYQCKYLPPVQFGSRTSNQLRSRRFPIISLLLNLGLKTSSMLEFILISEKVVIDRHITGGIKAHHAPVLTASQRSDQCNITPRDTVW